MDQSTEIQGKNISDKTIPKFSKTWIEYQKVCSWKIHVLILQDVGI
ncbi:hypothetical protein LEP1GSC116_3174 [Leptospira interrogans serovar Icterohaemorrhagiae str. Verdun HP]|uniref:Uncharacterized protein n=1 Tax=Leptospira interrogans serovar Icterohaemorrhagiae str. Verdun HP TaxID=1049910 RepID=M6R9V4_LEPIR|nr:hypothetical protein LEP1GSC116_3174 [Leptospira interrogans serovar Icterohaemorrhagiae str. Verdun HP]